MGRSRATLALIVALVVSSGPACGGGSKSTSPTTTTSTTAAPTTTTTAAPVEPKTAADITKAVETVLGSANASNTALVESLIEDGTTPAVTSVVDAGANKGQVYSVKVTAVRALDSAGCAAIPEMSPCAEVNFDLYTSATPDGTPALPGAQAHVVEVAGTWKLSRKSFCALIALGPEPHCTA